MAKAILVNETGGPEVLTLADRDPGDPGAGEVRVRQTAIGLNYIDVYFRTGLYPAPQLPFVPGMEGVGFVEAVGSGVSEFKVGDRIAYPAVLGAYAEQRLVAVDRIVPIPDTVNDETAAAMMLKGMTARYLLRETFPVQAGQTILFHAAAGGVGLLACQWANALGATVIGTVGSEEKAELARANGCHHTINYRTESFVDRVKELTGGTGCDVVYDSVGKDTFPGSLDCLKPKGMWVTFGNSSGPVPPFEMGILSQKGSLFATRPSLMTYIALREDLLANAADLFEVVGNGQVRVDIHQRYPLAEASKAHSDLEARKTTGATVLLP
ncbi:MAG: quinone oxidoreductase [Pseudomonadota bacterium]